MEVVVLEVHLNYNKGMQHLINILDLDYEFIFADAPNADGLWLNEGKEDDIVEDSTLAKISINYLSNFVENNGPFYGILGYSQGVAIALSYITSPLVSQQNKTFQKMLLFCGYFPIYNLDLLANLNNSIPLTNSHLIFAATNDEDFYETSLDLANYFEDSNVLISNTAGHALPTSNDSTFDSVVEYIVNPSETPDFELLYTSLDDYTSNFNSLNSSDNWLYYNPNRNSNFYFALVNRTHQQGDKLVVLKIDKRSGQVTTCTSTTPANSIYWNAINSNSKWLDIKVIYTNQGDYAYMCTEGSGFGTSNSSFNNRVVHIYKLDTLYENETYSCINTIPGISYHNLQVFQNNDVAYLYGVGGNRNALEIYDLSIDPEKPFYLGGYIAYPDGYNHSHEGSNDNDGNQLYIHDMQVSDQIEGQPGKIIGFLACIFNSTIVVVNLTNPLNVHNIIIIDDPRFKVYDNYGLHHCWLTPNNEFLITSTEADSNKTWVIDIKSIFEDGLTELLGNIYTKYVGQFQLLTNNLGNNLHNQYCYKIKDDIENFILLTAAYNSGTYIHVINYDEIRNGLLDIASNTSDNNLQDAIISDLRLKESYESNDAQDGFGTVWSVTYCPNSKNCNRFLFL